MAVSQERAVLTVGPGRSAAALGVNEDASRMIKKWVGEEHVLLGPLQIQEALLRAALAGGVSLPPRR